MSKRILVVDDEFDVRLLLSTLLTHEGWTISDAEDGESAIAAIAQAAPDLIVLDNMMPGITGIEVARQLRTDGHQVPIIIFSGYLSPGLRAEAEELSLWTCSKVDLTTLVKIIRELLDRPSARTADGKG